MSTEILGVLNFSPDTHFCRRFFNSFPLLSFIFFFFCYNSCMSTSTYQDPSPLERTLSWQDVRDTPRLSTRRSSTTQDDNGYRYVDCSNRKYRKPPLQFSISISCIDGDTKKTTCHPGSIFEGIVHMKLDTPLAAEHLKLVFKASGKKKEGKNYISSVF